jgi:hypothetical protein
MDRRARTGFKQRSSAQPGSRSFMPITNDGKPPLATVPPSRSRFHVNVA